MKRIKDRFTRKFKKRLIIIFGSLFLFVLLVLIFISPFTKYLIEKYDVKYTGREITMDWAYVNPFTGYVYFSNFKVHELKSEKIFFSANSIALNVSVLKLFTKTYEISELTLDKPWGIVIQEGKRFNFTDLIEKFAAKEEDVEEIIEEEVETARFTILNLKIIEGEFHFRDKLIPVNYFIKKVNFDSPGKRWDENLINGNYSFLSGIGKGEMEGKFSVDVKKLNYIFSAKVHEFDLKIIEQYLKDLTNYGTFSAFLDANIKAAGNFIEREAVTIKGDLAISDWHFGKNEKEDYFAFKKFVIAINEVSPKKHIYDYDSISVIEPYFKYERYDHLDNLQMMFGKEGSNIKQVKNDPNKFNLVIEIAEYVQTIAKNFFKSDYKLGRLAIHKADLHFNDHSTSEKFAMALYPLDIIADSIYKSNKRVGMTLKSGILPYGYVTASLSVNPNDSSDFNLAYDFKNLAISAFNPYTITYTSFPLDRGTLELHGRWSVRNGIIQSINHLIVIDPRLSKRIRNQDLNWVPMPLIMSVVRERGNVIDYQIPITGNLKDPKFHLWDVILDMLKNIFVKPPTTSYRMEVKNLEMDIERSFALTWKMRNNSLQKPQEKFIDKMVEFLVKNPDAFIDVYPQQYAIKEKEYILFYEAKKKYYVATQLKKNNLYTEMDSIVVEKMSVKDPLFVHYVEKRINDSLMFTIQDKCAAFVGYNSVNAKYAKMMVERKQMFVSHFKKKNVEARLRMHPEKNTVPYNGFSFYKIVYKGEYPDYLIKASQKMEELNYEEPRKKYRSERRRNRQAGKGNAEIPK